MQGRGERRDENDHPFETWDFDILVDTFSKREGVLKNTRRHDYTKNKRTKTSSKKRKQQNRQTHMNESKTMNNTEIKTRPLSSSPSYGWCYFPPSFIVVVLLFWSFPRRNIPFTSIIFFQKKHVLHHPWGGGESTTLLERKAPAPLTRAKELDDTSSKEEGGRLQDTQV